jgi:SAM-dependent methyltransferase
VTAASYDRIGTGYARTRRADPRIAHLIDVVLGDAVTVVNVGAGAGSYEPANRRVVAVEPSLIMIRQRPRDAAPAVVGRAEELPFADSSVDAALAILTVHHWSDPLRGLAELRRVARDRVVVLTWDPAFADAFWISEYLPSLAELDVPRFLPLASYEEVLGGVRVLPVPVPHDCTDGFMAAYWRRPEAYFDPGVRANSSAFSLLPADEVERGLGQLAEDLDSGAWDERNGGLRALEELDVGYRLLIAP